MTCNCLEIVRRALEAEAARHARDGAALPELFESRVLRGLATEITRQERVAECPAPTGAASNPEIDGARWSE